MCIIVIIIIAKMITRMKVITVIMSVIMITIILIIMLIIILLLDYQRGISTKNRIVILMLIWRELPKVRLNKHKWLKTKRGIKTLRSNF